MKITENFGLQKPDSNETFNIEIQNSNMDIIDEALKNLSNTVAYQTGSVAVTSSSTYVTIAVLSISEPGIYLILANTSESISGNTIGGCWIGSSGSSTFLINGGGEKYK